MKWCALASICLLSSLTLAQPAAAQDLPDEVPPPPPTSDSPPPPPKYNQPAPAPQPAEPAPAPAPEPTPSAEPAPAEAAPALAAPTCAPPCREGYVCLDGQCVEACNPPCAAGERCVDGGQCVAAAAPPAGDVPRPFFPPGESGYAPPAPPAGVETHDGFMLRLTLGLGGGVASRDEAGSEVELGGLAGSFSIDIGGSPVENLVVHGRLSDAAISEPTLTIDGEEIGSFDNRSFVYFLLGPAVTYYFMPINIYLTGALGVGFRGNSDDDDESSEGGVSLNLDIGKEWWAGDQWGLGAAARLWFSSVAVDLGNEQVDESFVAVCVLFSATYQ